LKYKRYRSLGIHFSVLQCDRTSLILKNGSNAKCRSNMFQSLNIETQIEADKKIGLMV